MVCEALALAVLEAVASAASVAEIVRCLVDSSTCDAPRQTRPPAPSNDRQVTGSAEMHPTRGALGTRVTP